jgi:uncharacterized protein
MEHAYLPRNIDAELIAWSKEESRKPLLLRGARQVGKSSAVRELSKRFEYFIEINFEEQRQVHSVFEGDLSPHELCENLSLYYNIPISPGKTLLFFDEIQSCLPAISSLRFFYEKYPELHLIAAGSLLEFALKELSSFGVGRVRSIFMYPFSYSEFLMAQSETSLLKTMQKATPDKPLQEAIHQKLLGHFKRFLILGGMPEVISCYVSHHDMLACQRILDDLLISLKADFVKYKQQVPALRILEVFDSVAQQSTGRFSYSRAATEANHKQVKEAVDLLMMAGLIIPVTHSSANGIPLGAEINPKKRKLLMFDTGLFQRVLGLNIGDLLISTDFDIINKGAIAELFVGLELQKSASCYKQEELYFWQREALNSNAEVDYLIQQGNGILPIEIKSGKKGSMQSLYLFLQEKKIPVGVRCSIENFGKYDRVHVIPLYAISNVRQNGE